MNASRPDYSLYRCVEKGYNRSRPKPGSSSNDTMSALNSYGSSADARSDAFTTPVFPARCTTTGVEMFMPEYYDSRRSRILKTTEYRLASINGFTLFYEIYPKPQGLERIFCRGPVLGGALRFSSAYPQEVSSGPLSRHAPDDGTQGHIPQVPPGRGKQTPTTFVARGWGPGARSVLASPIVVRQQYSARTFLDSEPRGLHGTHMNITPCRTGQATGCTVTFKRLKKRFC